MLSRARASGLCHGCRQDFQVFFENGFCGPAVTLRNRSTPLSLRWRRTFAPRQHLRPLSSKTTLLQHYSPPDSDLRQTKLENEHTSAVDIDPEQLEMLQELEKALGRPINEAIDEDRADGTSIKDIFPDKQIDLDDASDVVDGTSDGLAALRASGVSAEEIAREARQLYGDRLPSVALGSEELKMYKRLYGNPISVSYEEFLDEEEASPVTEVRNQLLDQDGEPIDYHSEPAPFAQVEVIQEEECAGNVLKPAQGGIGLGPTGEHNPALSASAEERAAQIARLLNGEIVQDSQKEEDQEEIEADEDEQDQSMRQHPFTRLGKFATTPSSVLLSQEDFVQPVQKIMSGYSNKHLKEMCEKTFGGPGLPDSPLTPRSGRSRQQLPIPLDASQHLMGEMEANAFITTIMPPTYAAIMAVLVETRKRLGSTWLNNLFAKEGGPRVLDAGAGGAGIFAWREIVKAHWDSLHSSDRDPVPPPPPTKSVVLTGSDTLRHRAAALLENTTFIPRLPDYVHTRDAPTLEDDRPAQQRKQFDVIIAPHTLFGLQEDYMKKQHVQNLWSMLSPEGGVLILIEKGIPRGFEAIAGARELLLERYIAVPEGRVTAYSKLHNAAEDMHTRETGMIVAPCTNHEKCPMYNIPGLSKGRKDFCSFQQRYIRPSYLQRVLGAKDRNHDDVDFSYISVMKGEDLRQRQVQSWQGLEDSLAAPRHPDSQLAAQDSQNWTQLSQNGFEELHPTSNLTDAPSIFADADKVPSTLPSTHNLPRLVFQPMKRRGHVLLDVCTPSGKIERWTVPKSFSKQAYRDARKSQWGDLWALGAKTRIPRSLRLGGEDTKEAKKARGRKERLRQQAEELMERMHEEQLEELEDQKQMERAFREGRIPSEVDDDIHSGDAAGKASRPGRIRREKASNGIESFTFDDVDHDALNPPLFPSTAKTRTATLISHPLSKQSQSSAPADQDEQGDLTIEELQTLQEWDEQLTAGEAAVPTKGRRSVRRYSKFAPRGMKTAPRKSGKFR
ncbi:37S ribosomal protein Rsm22 [Fonsecaea pedrosoi]|nr:37S ribosomal protein Rsm22 [Fonsecaea pedrosoi]